MSEELGPQKNWWQTIPGLLTAAAGVITAIAGLIVALHQAGIWEKKDETKPSTVVSPPRTNNEARKDQPPPLPVREEKEPNDQITAANPILVGATIRGRIATDRDRDWFTFKAPSKSAGKIRVILRKFFEARVEVYDAAEHSIASQFQPGDTPVSFSFPSNPASDYFILVKSDEIGQRGEYELVVREE